MTGINTSPNKTVIIFGVDHKGGTKNIMRFLKRFLVALLWTFLIPQHAFTFSFQDTSYHITAQHNMVSLYYLEQRLLQGNPLIKDKQVEIDILNKSLSNFKGENKGDLTFGLSYYPSSYYAEHIVGYTYGVSGRWRYPLLGEYGDIKYKELQLKSLIYIKKAELEKLKNKLLYDLRSAYVDYYYSFLVENELKNAIFELQDIELRLKQRYRMKLSLWTDVLTVDTLITKLRTSLSTVYENRLKSLAKIRALVADPYLPEFYPQLDYNSRLTFLYIPPSNELAEFAREHRKDLEYIKKAYTLLSKAADEYGNTYPKAWVSVIGTVTSYDWDRVDSGMGISLDFTLPWHKSKAEKALKAERALRAQRELIRKKLEETNLITDVQNAVSNFEIYRNKYLAFKKEYESVRQNRLLFEKRLNAGLYGGGDGLIRLASLVNQEIGSYQLMMLNFKNMLIQYFSLLKAIGVRELPWIVRSASHSFTSPVLTTSKPERIRSPELNLLLFAYVWNSEDFLGNPSLEIEFIKSCNSLGLNGIYLSLNGEQIREFLGNFAGNQKLMKFISLAKSKGLSVQLLLGENSWIYPDNREKLLAIVNLFNRFNKLAGSNGFDGLHLDIEPHSLTQWKFEKAKLEQFYLETLSEVKRISNKPVIVDISPVYLKVEFQGYSLADKVFSVVDGVNVMAYTTDLSYLKRICENFSHLASTYGKPITISLSVEENLSDLETFFRRPKDFFFKALKVIESSGIDSVAFQDYTGLVNYMGGNPVNQFFQNKQSLEHRPLLTKANSYQNRHNLKFEIVFTNKSSIPKEVVVK